jgi:hypothetical protein
MQNAYPFRRAVNVRHAHRTLFLLLLLFILLAPSHSFSQTPSMIITSPYYTPDHGYSVSGTVTLGAHLANARNVEKVEFYVDGHLVNTVRSYPYSCLWPGSQGAQGLHELEVVAYQKNGNRNSLLEVFNMEPAATATLTATEQVAKTKDAEGIYYKLDASANSHADRHTEGLTLWKSTDGENWIYGGLVWSFEGDGNAAEKQWNNLTKKPTRLVKGAIVYTNNNFYITGRFTAAENPSLLASTTGKPEGPYAPASPREAADYKASLARLNANDQPLIRVYPNPSAQSFRLLTVDPLHYTVCDVAGQIIASGTAVAGTTFGASLKPGIYLLSVITPDGQSKTFRLLKN